MGVTSLVSANIEKTKEWLSRYADNERQLDDLIERIEALRSRLTSPRSAALSGMPHGGGYEADSIGRSLATLEKLEEEAQTLLARSRELYREINTTIDQSIIGPGRPYHRTVLKCRYLDLFSWHETLEIMFARNADFMDRYDSYERRMHKIHRAALEQLQIPVTDRPGQENDQKEEHKK